jgi:hypothetical protein
VSGPLPHEFAASRPRADGAVGPVIRKLVTYTEDFLREGGRDQTPPVRLAAAIAVVANPYAGRYVEDLSALANRFGPPLGELLGARVIELLDGAAVEAYGKGALVGERGEIEHGSAIIHTLRFGDPFRERAGGTSLLPSAEKRGACGATLDLALKHKHDTSVRSHHWTFEVRVPDAPHADEIVVVCAAATGGRPNARIGRGPADDYAE